MQLILCSHARRQCELRGIDTNVILRVIDHKLDGVNTSSAAVYVGRLTQKVVRDEEPVLGSNGDQVWAIVRNGFVKTVMFRRSSQPATCEALRVELVAA